LTVGERRAILRLFDQEERAVNPSVAAQLKAFNLAAISARLQTVAAEWARLEVEQLPVRDKTLALLQAEYAELLAALPVSEPAELAPLLQQAARAMRLKGDGLSVSQDRFLVSQLDGGPHPQGMTLHPADSPGAAAYVRSIGDHPGTLVRSFTGGSLLYLVSHWRLGAEFPTFPTSCANSCVRPPCSRRWWILPAACGWRPWSGSTPVGWRH
jgi:hypothetical protein